MWGILFLVAVGAVTPPDRDDEASRKVLGSSVVTSVSVIMDAGNGSKVYSDPVGRPVPKPQLAGDLGSPIELLHPDRYEFYTFDDSGDLVKRLMTLEEIHDIIATGDEDGFTLDTLSSSGFIPEKRVNDVVNNVQNVIKEEIKLNKKPETPQLDTPDVSGSWSMILPAVFGNYGQDIKPEKPLYHSTPDTIMVEPTIKVVSTTEQISTTHKVGTLQTRKTTTKPKITTTTSKTPVINVEIITNSNSTTEKTVDADQNLQVVEIKPLPEIEMTKENLAPLGFKSTKKPHPIRVTTFRPVKKPVRTKTTTRITSTTPKTTSTATTTISTTSKITSTTTTTTSTTPDITTTFTTKPVWNEDSLGQSSTVVEKVELPTTLGTTLKPQPDFEVQASTIAFEKVEPPTTLKTTTSKPLPQQDFVGFLTTVVEKLTATTPEPLQTKDDAEQPLSVFEKILPISTSEKPFSTLEPFSTTEKPSSTEVTEQSTTFSTLLPQTTTQLTTLGTESGKETTTTLPETPSTWGGLSTFFIVSDTKNLQKEDDLSTLSSEYVASTINNKIGTTEAQPSSTLDQLLLTSTNIYEINSELSNLKSTTDFDSSTTSSEESETERVFIKLTNPTEPPTTTFKTTTDQSFIESIEQLISQAVGTVEPPVENLKEANIVEMMLNSTNSNKTMPEVVAETATVASNMVATEETTTSGTTTTGTTTDDLLSDSMSSLLSQVFGGLTTVEESTQTPPTTATEVPTTEFVPHIINITIIRNENRTLPKPAKSDLSLEKEYENLYKEMQKNATLVPVVPTTEKEEILKTEATSSLNDQTDFTESTTEGTTELPKTQSTTDGTTELPKTTTDRNEEKNWTLVATIPPKKEVTTEPPVDLVPKPLQGFGLEDSTAKLDSDIYQFVQLCNELAFGFWRSVSSNLGTTRSLVLSPFAATSLLAMVFLGARGSTSGEMNEILKLDDMVTFNPHLIFKNVSESIEASSDSGVAVSAIVRELYSDRSKGKLLGFYKERVRQFYDGHVEEASFKDIGDTVRRRTNLLVKKSTNEKIPEFLKDGAIIPRPPLAGVSASIFHTDCSSASTAGRDGELHFVVSPSLRQRRLVPVPAVVFRSGFVAGYEPSLDATAAALGTKHQTISAIFIVPGQQGSAAPGDGLARLEKRLMESAFAKGAWGRLMRALIPRPGLELQVPRFVQRSVVNATEALRRMGLHDLFDAHRADLKGLNGAAHELHLSDVIQVNEFATCGERGLGAAHHRETWPEAASTVRGRRLVEAWRAFDDSLLHDPEVLSLPLALRPRQARLPDQVPRLRFDRPFLYVVRHNPSGLVLHMGRFHPRLLP